jgi:hypothetical protein
VVAVVAEPFGGVSGAAAVVAVDDDVGVGVVEETGGGFCEGGEREEFRALDFAEVPFVEFADIDEAEGGLGVEEG